MSGAHLPTSELHEQLNRNSTPYQDPLARVDWDALSREDYWLPETAISLYGTAEYTALPEPRRRALSQLEYLHLLQAGLWLEGIFMERLARSLRRPDPDLARHAYRLHELREEAGHSLMFLELIRRSGVEPPAGGFRHPRLADLLGRHAPFASAPFWVAVLIGEEIPDRVNRYVRKHRDHIAPPIFEMVTLHIIDEARHIAHVRDLLGHRLPRLGQVQRTLLRPLLHATLRQFTRVFYFPQAPTYEAAGLSPGAHWARVARDNPRRADFVEETLRPTLRALMGLGFQLDWR